MNNLEKAKAKVEEKNAELSTIENILNPPPAIKRIKTPPQRDINLIQNILTKRLEEKSRIFTAKIEENIKQKYAGKFEPIHIKAMELRQEAMLIGKEIEKENAGKVIIKFMDKNSYSSGYLDQLPETIDEARKDLDFTINDDYPILENLQAEIDEFILNVKLGIESIARVKPLLEKIDKELKI